jgi:hypothetical protein
MPESTKSRRVTVSEWALKRLVEGASSTLRAHPDPMPCEAGFLRSVSVAVRQAEMALQNSKEARS